VESDTGFVVEGRNAKQPLVRPPRSRAQLAQGARRGRTLGSLCSRAFRARFQDFPIGRIDAVPP